MKYLVTNLSSVPSGRVNETMSERLNLLSPGPERERGFADAARYAGIVLNLRVVVEFLPDRTWAAFLDETDRRGPVVFSLAEDTEAA